MKSKENITGEGGDGVGGAEGVGKREGRRGKRAERGKHKRARGRGGSEEGRESTWTRKVPMAVTRDHSIPPNLVRVRIPSHNTHLGGKDGGPAAHHARRKQCHALTVGRQLRPHATA